FWGHGGRSRPMPAARPGRTAVMIYSTHRLWLCGTSLAALAVALCVTAAPGGEPKPADPVDQPREALRADRDPGKAQDALEFRAKSLERRAASVNRLPDLGRALLLQEWRDEGLDAAVARVDKGVRERLCDRFRTALRDTLRKGDVLRRAAAANFVGEMSGQA